jgi:S1-C subfamily serine protease
MEKPKNKLRTPFLSALLGGAVVAVIGLIAISAGWIKSDSKTTTVTAPISAPISSNSSDEGEGNTVNQIYKADGEGVAFIESQIPASEPEGGASPFGEFFGEAEPEEESGGGVATGSGFVIDEEGHILTNNHVIEGADKINVKIGDSEKEYQAEVVGADPGSDLALLKVNAPSSLLHPLTLGDSAKAEVGDPVVAIGNPFGLDRTVTSGIVSALQRSIQAPNGFSISNVIQTDAAINPGNSGGPLINAEGEVIGINSQIETGGSGSEGNVGIGFSIPINTAKQEIHQLETKGEVEHAFLGIEGGSITPELAKALNLSVTEGVIVQSVVKGGPADKAGIEGGKTTATIEGAEVKLGGDIITEIDGKKITSMEDVIEVVQSSQPGEEIEVQVLHDGQKKSAHVTLGTQPKKAGQS